MGKVAPNDTLDQQLNYMATATRQVACSAEPTDGNDALTVVDLATATMAGGDFAIADGNVNGRKITMAAKNTVTIDHSGNATHIALVILATSKLIGVTTCTLQGLTAGGTVDFPSWKWTLADPT